MIGSELKGRAIKAENEIQLTIYGEVKADKWSKD